MKNKRIKRLIIILAVIGAVTGFMFTPWGNYVRSRVVMGIYSPICARDGIPEAEDFEIDIPGGRETPEDDWYPKVLTFCADENFSRRIGVENTKLTILYNFPSFSMNDGCSRLYDTDSPYYSGFYGAYIVQRGDKKEYGVDRNGNVNSDEIAQVSMFDYSTLVLRDFGLPTADFNYDFVTTGESRNHTISGIDGWTRLEGVLTVPGCSHIKDDFRMSYIQYGPPEFEKKKPFTNVEMQSIIYAKYFEDINTGIFLYIMVPGKEEAANTERNILLKTELDFKK